MIWDDRGKKEKATKYMFMLNITCMMTDNNNVIMSVFLVS